MNDALTPLRDAGVVAVLRAPSAAACLSAVAALVAGGVTGIEVTYSTPDAPAVIERVRERHPEALVGAGTVLTAVSLGVDGVKVFPASLGGPAYLRALRGPFPDVPLMPTGGVDAHNLAEWFAAGAFAAGDRAAITERAREFVRAR